MKEKTENKPSFTSDITKEKIEVKKEVKKDIVPEVTKSQEKPISEMTDAEI